MRKYGKEDHNKLLSFSFICQARRDLNDPENAIIGAFAGALEAHLSIFCESGKNNLEKKNLVNKWSKD